MSTKRILSLVLALVMVLGTFGTVFAAEPTGNVKVDWLVEQGIVTGDENGNLMLDKTIDRASVAKMVVEALDQKAIAEGMQTYKSSFKDVPATHWSNGNINVVSGQGLMIGNDNNFMPSATISYAEVITILVRMIDGEQKNAVWPTSYIAKALELGVMKDVTVANYSFPAVREDILEMFYNAMVNKKVGNYSIVKGIVLENYRVVNLAKDEVVVEIIKELQKSDYTTKSRAEQGDQVSLTIPAKVADVENLLGKVADFTLDKDGKVVAVKIDETYKYEVGELSTTKDSLKVAGKEYTVRLDERYKLDDERIFRTYFNNSSKKYVDFGTTTNYVDKAEFARVTTKNGKVLFIDAFEFEDIAPVKEVKNDGKAVYIHDDTREGTAKKIDFDSKTKVVIIKGTDVKVGSLTDIEAMDVIHYVDNTVFVRTDAMVEGNYEKYSTSRVDLATLTMFVDGEKYTVAFPLASSKRLPVFSYDGEVFETLKTQLGLSSKLEKLVKKEVTLLLDMNDNVQYITSEIKDPSFIAIFDQANGSKARLVKADGTKEVYESTFDTKYVNVGPSSTTKYQSLFDFNVGDLVVAETKDSDLSKLTFTISRANMVLGQKDVTKITSSKITLEDGTFAYIEPSTKVFINTATVRKGMSVSELLKAYDLNKTSSGVINSKVYITYQVGTSVADSLVFVEVKGASASTKTVVAKVVAIEGATADEYYVQLEDMDGNRTNHWMDKSEAVTIRKNDIVSVEITKDDDAEIDSLNSIVISATAPVYKIVKVSGRYITLEGNNGVTETRYLLSGSSVFGEIGVDEYVAIPANGKNGDAISVIFERTVTFKAGQLSFGKFETLDQLAANAVMDSINALPAVGALTIANKAAVVAARAAYDALTAEQKALVPATTLEALIAAEAKIVELDVNKTALTAALAAAAEKLEAGYTAASWTVFTADLAAAKALPETTQAEVDAKVIAVNAAIAKLDVKPAVPEFKALLEDSLLPGAIAARITFTDLTVDYSKYEAKIKATAFFDETILKYNEELKCFQGDITLTDKAAWDDMGGSAKKTVISEAAMVSEIK